jgi:transposase-like protein
MEENKAVAPTRRRRHSAEFKAEAIKACMQPGISIAAVALHYRLNANMLRTWVSAHEERAAMEKAHASMNVPKAEFIPLQLTAVQEAATPDIVIEVRRGAATVTIRWPHTAAADCAGWLHGWLR